MVSTASAAVPLPRRFGAFAGLTVALAAVSVIATAMTTGWQLHNPARLALLGAFVVAGELLPIPVPRRAGLDRVTISTPFAFAALLTCGILPACAAYAGASAIADLTARISLAKVVFNAAQYAVSMLAAGAVLTGLAQSPPVVLSGGALMGILLAGLACLLVNHILAGTGAALLSRTPVLPYLLSDLGFQGLTEGCLIVLAPGVVASANAGLALIPLAFVPMLVIYVGGRQATTNAHRAVHDLLTDLPNRAQLIERLNASIRAAERTRLGVAVMIVDLDDFKAINDTLGHEFGDRVLQQIAPRLAEALGPHGMLARLGGDEFAVVLEEVADLNEPEAAAQRLLDALDRPLELDSLTLHIAGSIGVAAYPQHGRSVEELLRHADVALYCAKDERSTCAVYADEDDDYSVDRLALAAQLRRGIERGELICEYQPKLPLCDDLEPGVEALVRWNHPQLGRLEPEGFIPLAEQSGLIGALTEQVLQAALEQCTRWRGSGLQVRVSVNLSTRSLLDHELPATIAKLLQRFGVPARSLQLEITESRSVADLRRAQDVLHELRQMGVTIAIDDFGTGFSSLSQLQQLPVDEIKIDRSFVIGMETNADDAALVRSIIDLGQNLGLRVTAEGVETAGVHRTLRELGCDFAQGYYVGRPVGPEECRRLIDARTRTLPSRPPTVFAARAAAAVAG